MKLTPLLVFVGIALPLAIAGADSSRDRHHPHHPPGQPPPAAIAACDGAAVHDACSFSIDDHAITGTCEQGPDADKPLACRPDQPPPPPPPPAEAIAACAKAAEGDACSFALGDRTITGTCARGPDADKPLACRPDRLPPPRR